MLFNSADSVMATLRDVLEIQGNSIRVVDDQRLRERAIDDLVYNAVLHPSEAFRYYLSWLIREAAAGQVNYAASAHGLYKVLGGPGAERITLPALSSRALTYDFARACFMGARERAAEAFVFILPEQRGDGIVSPLEFATCVLGAAIKERHQGPVFLLADHIRPDPQRWRADHDRELERLHDQIDEAFAAGFCNFDFDAASLVDYTRPGYEEQQQANAWACAELAAYVHGIEPTGVACAVGGVIGELCEKEQNTKEIRAFSDAFIMELADRTPSAPGLSKILLHTGRTQPESGDGSVIDLDLLSDLGEIARREYGLCLGVRGFAIHAEEQLDRFRDSNVAEVHLPDLFEHIILEHPACREVTVQMDHWAEGQLGIERPPGQSDDQFRYYGRKRAITEFKKAMWDLPAESHAAIVQTLKERLTQVFDRTGCTNTAGLVRDAIAIREVKLPAPISGYYQNAETTLHTLLQEMGTVPPFPAGRS